ncbi:TlpA disulfide reductase family protein [Pedobacter sp. JY14-1]|uniref:TlpA disulfide reductase family protein n=1 Tax=Pedobacter sp. JY14-1 TaxID=3034151 RepID=UPI0023E31108|nr:TlpA disulfide reductase family protein [Pedobacter sp. JY14-1]
MRKIAYLLVIIVFAFTSCKDKSKFVISGAFKNATPKSKVYLYGLDANRVEPLDSTVFSEKGEFKFTHSTPGVDFFRVSTGNNEYMVIAENGDDIKLIADLTDKNLGYSVSGAKEADKLQELNATKNAFLARMGKIQAEFDEAVAKQPDHRDAIMSQMAPRYNQEMLGLNDAVLKFAKENTQSLSGFYAINMLNPQEHEQDMVDYADKIKGNFPGNAAVADFIKKMSALKTVQVGQTAPDFTIPGLDGGQVSLSEFKGKYLLIDFWASWCMPCRQENPNVVKAYRAFKDKNFTILGISLDKDANAWRKAIADDGLTWNHGGELKDFDSDVARKYQIEAIPSSFLIDPQGKIIAKNLRGAELEAFLSKTL